MPEQKIIGCSCKHEFQDQEYGQNRRLTNPTNKGHRCTVCGKEQTK